MGLLSSLKYCDVTKNRAKTFYVRPGIETFNIANKKINKIEIIYNCSTKKSSHFLALKMAFSN